ncbi:DUF1775 domain-containing protein [Agrococcus jejuensis]|uniref:DUF1775 domain-containing protein n=1 Tax=Agrococcus jejuensis TaxID=399736 RepID=UPI0011A6FE65|nr:DUF1775 domain-containing protein [Agrococcus jejuensis]
MSPSRTIAGASVGVAALLLALSAPAAASAHVTVDGTSTAPGTASTLSFTIEHGCDASPTTAVTIAIPDEVSAVTPIANAGWTIEADLAAPGRTMTYVAQTPLPSAVHDTLVMDVTFPDDLPEGTVLAFPVEQTCEVGSLAWDSTAADADHPAPQLAIAAPVVEEAPAAEAGGVGPVGVVALIAAVVAAALATIALRRQQASR